MTARSQCCADYCMSIRSKESKFLFHPFPKDPEVREKWLAAMGRPAWHPPPCTILCSAHFTDDCYQEIMGIKYIKLSAVPSIFIRSGQPRPNGILKRSVKKPRLEVLSDTGNTDQCSSNQELFERKQNAQAVESDDLDVIEMTEVYSSPVSKPSGVIKSKPYKPRSRKPCQSLITYLRLQDASVQTEKTTMNRIVQTETSVRNPDEDLGDASRFSWQVESLKEKLGHQRIQIFSLRKNLRLMMKEVNKLQVERNMLSGRLNEETMSAVEKAFKEVLQEFLQDDHSNIEELLTRSGQLCLNTHITFKKKDEG